MRHGGNSIRGSNPLISAMKNIYYKSTIIAIAILTIVFSAWFYEKKFSKEASGDFVKNLTVFIDDTKINANVAQTNEERIRGLSGRLILSKSSGLFFIFNTTDYHGIWMKEMLFPIDIIWIDESYRIVDIKENVDPSSYPKVFTPQTKARYVLEVNAGFVKTHGVKVGDYIVKKQSA